MHSPAPANKPVNDTHSKQATVDFVIPCLNAGQAILTALDSLKAQTAYDNIGRVIIVNDGSTENSTLEALSIAESRPDLTVRVIHNEQPTGPGAARNRGAHKAVSPYLAFLDADDTLLPTSLETRLHAISFAEASFVTTDFYLQDHDKKIEDVGFFASRPRPRSLLADAFQNQRPTVYRNPFPLFLQATLGHLCTLLLPREMFILTGGFREDLPWLEDYEFFLRLARNYQLVFFPNPTFVYHHNPKSTTNRDQPWPPGHWGKQVFRTLLSDPTIRAHRDLIRKGISRRAMQNARYWLEQNRFSDALAEAKEALGLTPLSVESWQLLISLLFHRLKKNHT